MSLLHELVSDASVEILRFLTLDFHSSVSGERQLDTDCYPSLFSLHAYPSLLQLIFLFDVVLHNKHAFDVCRLTIIKIELCVKHTCKQHPRPTLPPHRKKENNPLIKDVTLHIPPFSLPDRAFLLFFIALTSLAAVPRLCFSASILCLSPSLFQR